MAGTLGRGRRRGEPICGINVTPLVDVVLVLLIVLMVTSTYIVAQVLRVQLPKAKSSDGVAENPATVILTKDGGLFWNDVPASEETLQRELRASVTADPAVSLVVSADQSVPHGRVVRVLDVAKLAGVTRFAINVQSE